MDPKHDNQVQAADKPVPLFTKQFLLVSLVNFLLFTSFQFFPSALPLYAQPLGASDGLIGMITAAGTLSSIVARPIAGMILDTRGRKPIFLVGMAVMALATLLFSFFPYAVALVPLMLIRGFGWGISSTSSNTTATDLIPRERFGEGMAYFGLSISFALAIAPALGVKLITTAGIHVVVGISVAFIVVSMLIVSRLEYKKVERIEPQNVKVIEKSALLPAFIFFFISFTYGGVISFLAVHATILGIKDISWYFFVYAIATLVSRPLIGKLVDRIGVNITVFGGLVLVIPALVIIACATTLWHFLVAAVLYGFGFATLHTSLQTLALKDAPPERRGVANGTYLFGMDGGIMLGSVISGIVAGFAGYPNLFLFLAAMPLGAAIVFALYQARHKKKAASAGEL